MCVVGATVFFGAHPARISATKSAAVRRLTGARGAAALFSLENRDSLFLPGRGNGGFLKAVCAAELLGELVHASGRIHELLLAGKERMAGVADIDVDLCHRATRHKGIPARAMYRAG